ncbi:HNH endonuclease signature motif containing protein [Flavobacterium sp. 270]|uniref:HNH endonuclease signature motif containing protein n=1 Tax=Flavobacterium sp. 270 TaxID=2512114 RepID=UPI001AB02F7A|nr:HNH endonuclease signature motif containing protein [Flavobacterium sp. 270]
MLLKSIKLIKKLTMVDLKDFKQESECIYKNERYSVRDNGAVLRYPLEGKRPRPTDNNWTFGKLNIRTGYLEIASVRIHRIVATAFHNEAPTKEHVVDHIDTNKQNNRPTNLRWVTRLENILLNPITAKRIEIICGSIEAFLANPSKFRDKFADPNYEWMCTVSIGEAQISLERMLSWANSDKPLKGGSLGEWIFNREIVETPSGSQPNYMMSKTPNAAQRINHFNDKPNEYPSTPQMFEGHPLKAYYNNLIERAPFFRNHNGDYIVVKRGFSKDKQTLYVMTKSAYVWREQENGDHISVPISELSDKNSIEDLPHSLNEVTYEDGLFVHSKMDFGFHPTEELEEIFTKLTQDLKN